MQSESTLSRQSAARAVHVHKLTRREFDAPEAIATRLASIREGHISELITVIAGDSNHRQLAVKVLDLAWNCLNCRAVSQ